MSQNPFEGPKPPKPFDLMADLRKKYNLPEQPQEIKEEVIQPSMTWRERHEEQKRALEGSHEAKSNLDPSEINALKIVQKKINSLIENFEKRFNAFSPGSDEYRKQAFLAINEVVAYLNSLSIWQAKFSTSPGSGTDESYKERTHEDSLYFLSDAGPSIRIKRAAMSDGYTFRQAIQPFMEIILFRPPGERYHYFNKPEVGYTVIDGRSMDFKALFADSVPATDTYTLRMNPMVKNGTIVGFTAPEDAWVHDGNRINWIADE
jgi:hypothetical protein